MNEVFEVKGICNWSWHLAILGSVQRQVLPALWWRFPEPLFWGVFESTKKCGWGTQLHKVNDISKRCSRLPGCSQQVSDRSSDIRFKNGNFALGCSDPVIQNIFTHKYLKIRKTLFICLTLQSFQKTGRFHGQKKNAEVYGFR